MITALRRRATFANVTSLLALFIALGGTSYAALQIHGSQIKNRTISAKKVKRNTLGGREIRESKLRKVRRAKRADRLGKYKPTQLRLRCPQGTLRESGICVELQARPPTAYGGARVQCAALNRRLPSHQELANAAASVGLSPGGELTGSVYGSGSGFQVVTVINTVGDAGSVPDTAAGAKPFRCVAYPSN